MLTCMGGEGRHIGAEVDEVVAGLHEPVSGVGARAALRRNAVAGRDS